MTSPISHKWDLYVWCVPPDEPAPNFLHVDSFESYHDACAVLAQLFNDYDILSGIIHPPSGERIADGFDRERAQAKEFAETLEVETDWLEELLSDEE